MEIKDNPQLLKRFKEGDKEVLTELYRAHVAAVSELLRRGFSFRSGTEFVRFSGFSAPHQLQEMVQDTFIRAFRQQSREAYDGKRPFRPFLITISKNLVIDGFRREGVEKRLFVPMGRLVGEGESPEDAASRMHGNEPALTPEEETIRTQLKEVLAAFMETLDGVERQIVDEHLLGELSQRDMAEALGVDRNELRRRLKGIRERLLKHLKASGFISDMDPSELLQSLMVFSWLK